VRSDLLQVSVVGTRFRIWDALAAQETRYHTLLLEVLVKETSLVGDMRITETHTTSRRAKAQQTEVGLRLSTKTTLLNDTIKSTTIVVSLGTTNVDRARPGTTKIAVYRGEALECEVTAKTGTVHVVVTTALRLAIKTLLGTLAMPTAIAGTLQPILSTPNATANIRKKRSVKSTAEATKITIVTATVIVQERTAMTATAKDTTTAVRASAMIRKRATAASRVLRRSQLVVSARLLHSSASTGRRARRKSGNEKREKNKSASVNRCANVSTKDPVNRNVAMMIVGSARSWSLRRGGVEEVRMMMTLPSIDSGSNMLMQTAASALHLKVLAMDTNFAMSLGMPLVMLPVMPHLARHTISQLLHSRLAHSLEHTTASKLQTAIPIDPMITSPAEQHMRRHLQPTMRMRITVVAWNKSSGSLAFLLRIPARTLTQIVSAVAASARSARPSVKAASRMATTVRLLATMINLHLLLAHVPALRTTLVKHPAKALGLRHRQTLASKSFVVALVSLTRQWMQASWHRLLTTVRARSERTACVSSIRHRKRTTRGQRAY
jgi:hypothetical protein